VAPACAAQYRARNPSATPLYRLFDAHYDEVRGQWEERYERRYSFWRSFVDEQVLRYLDCGLFENGFARIRCPDCAGEYLHGLVSRGGWTRDGEWIPVAFVDEQAAEFLFRHKVIHLLQDVGLLSEERTRLLLSWRHTGFSVHNRVRVEPEDGAAVERLARYIMRPPISLERMAWDGVGEVCYRRKRGHESAGSREREVEEFDPREFLARVIMHIPEP
jgi:hypothetical protein